MSIEAMYNVQFNNEKIYEFGICILETERVFGGDSSFTYIGSYKFDQAGKVNVNIKVNNDIGSMESINGLDNYTLIATAEITDNNFDKIELVGYAEEDNEKSEISVNLVRRAELP